MALQVRRSSSIKVRLITTLIAVFALVAQPLYGFVSAQIVDAAPVDTHVVVNEIMAFPQDGQNEWIELYNPTNADVSLVGWNIIFGGGQQYAIQTPVIAAKSYAVVDGPDANSYISNDSETIGLANTNGVTVDSVTYSAITQGKSYARSYDAADTFTAQATPSKNATNGPVPIAACATTSQVHSTSLTAWDRGDTRANGHNELVSGGLRVYTDGSTDEGSRTDGAPGNWNTDKAAGYHALNIPLSKIGQPAIEFASTAGGLPGLQLGLDRDGNGTWDGYLVNEGNLYGANNWWVNKDGFGVPAGGGYKSLGSLSQYLAANPNAVVLSFGYSLGSGVKGDVVISKITAGCTDYTFGLDKTAPAVPSVSFYDQNTTQKYSAGFTATENFTFKLANAQSDETARYQLKYWNVIPGSGYNGSDRAWSLNDMAGYSSALGVYNDRFSQGEGKHYFSFSACDAAGNCSDFSQPFEITYDKTAPTDPAGLQLFTKAGKQITNGYTNAYDVTAKWTASSDVNGLSYQYKYWNTIASSAYNKSEANAEYWNVGTGTTNPGVFNQGEGQHYLAVRSIDNAGNVSAWTDSFGVIYDATKPMIAASADKDTTVSGTKTFTINQTEANPSTLYVEYMEKNPAGVWQKKLGKEFTGNTADLVVDTTKWNDGLHQIKVTSKDKAGNSAGYSFTVTVANPQPMVVGENFNTYAGADYKGISVGFSIDNFKTVNGVSVSLYDAAGNLLVENVHNTKLLDLINDDGVKQLSTPFIVTPGTYNEEYWQPGAREWKAQDKPAKAVIAVTGTNSAGLPATRSVDILTLTEPDGVMFDDTLPTIVNLPPVVDEDDDESVPVSGNTNGSTTGTLPLVAPIILVNTLPGATTFLGNVFDTSFAAGAADAGTTPASDNNAAVLGTQDKKTSTPLADTAAIVTADKNGGIFNLAWYWWVVLFAAAISGWLLLAAVIRRIRGTEL